MAESKDVAKRETFDREDLRAIDSFQTAVQMATETYGELVTADGIIGDGFSIVEDKRVCIGVPMVFLDWRFNHEGDFGSFVSIRAVAEIDGNLKKWIINDGSTGLFEELMTFTSDTGKTGGLVCKRGLRVSEYDTDAEGKPTTDKALAKGRGATFYIDASA
jgi:hypothetical protein